MHSLPRLLRNPESRGDCRGRGRKDGPARPITGKADDRRALASLGPYCTVRTVSVQFGESRVRGRRASVARADRKTVGYCRVSTEEQSAEGVSLAAQEVRIQAWGAALERHVDEIVTDAGFSAKDLDGRPGVRALLDRVKAGQIGAVVVLKLDRLTRSVGDLTSLLALFEKHETALISMTESLDTSTAVGRLMLNLLGSVAQWEREAIGERTAFALGHKRKGADRLRPHTFRVPTRGRWSGGRARGTGRPYRDARHVGRRSVAPTNRHDAKRARHSPPPWRALARVNRESRASIADDSGGCGSAVRDVRALENGSARLSCSGRRAGDWPFAASALWN